MSFKAVAAAALALLLAGAIVLYYYAGQEPGPLVKIEKPAAIGGGPVPLDVTVDSVGTTLRRLEVSVEQQGRVFTLFSLDAPGEARFVQETAHRIRVTQESPAGALTGLRDGSARLVVTASRDVLYGIRRAEAVETRELAVRLTPPKLAIVSMHHYVNLGGAEMVVYRVTPADAASGVQVGNRYYPGYPAAGAAGSLAPGAPPVDPALRVAFFALLHDDDISTRVRLVARDPAGNAASAEFAYRAFPAEFARRRLPVTDAFFKRVVPPILEATPALTLPVGTPEERLEAFLRINGDLRRANQAQIEDLARVTSPEMLWRGTFARMGRAKSEALFADHRTYVFEGRDIDQQVHLGADLASTRGAAITASNTGHVVFAGFLGIYGNCVVLDHGMGVQSLYAHLSSVTVEAGDRINRRETIGRSGDTGLAGGDHLHFTMLVAGRPVNPIEWWDPHWIADRVDRKLVEAGIMSASAATKAPVVTPPAKKKAPARAKAKPAAPKKKAPAKKR
ncbi:MAG: M23 family metallopeptidase [Vicinamibacterales bacterium]|jgi:murein DD-endopeptidase MepM/ murein hydrolase activator NlpD|nr:M23 family metallopeptidase [Vicinamibacterales bacterium]